MTFDLKKGGLHEALGITAGAPIPVETLMAHKNSNDVHMRKMVNFALNARKFKHAK